jgi:hypothetical protein
MIATSGSTPVPLRELQTRMTTGFAGGPDGLRLSSAIVRPSPHFYALTGARLAPEANGWDSG